MRSLLFVADDDKKQQQLQRNRRKTKAVRQSSETQNFRGYENAPVLLAAEYAPVYPA